MSDFEDCEYKPSADDIHAENRRLRAENARLRDINRWNIERDGDDIYICESNHHRSDKCEYERWYHRAYVDALRDDNAELKRIMVDYRRRMSSFIFDYKTLEDECDVMRADKRRLKEELEALRAENARLQAQKCRIVVDDALRIIGEQRDEIVRLREALKPFADRAKYAEKHESVREYWPVAIAELRVARAAMGDGDE